MSEEVNDLIEMARTIRMMAEQWNPTSRKARDVGHRSSTWCWRSAGILRRQDDSVRVGVGAVVIPRVRCCGPHGCLNLFWHLRRD